jgi:hypothetical protein
MVLTLDFGLSLADADPLQPISRIIPAANIANFFTILSLTRPKASLSKNCTGGEADAQSSDECTEIGEIIHLFAVHYGVAGLYLLHAWRQMPGGEKAVSHLWRLEYLAIVGPGAGALGTHAAATELKKRRLRQVSGE